MRFYEDGSDIWFGDFDDADCFRIENSNLYQKSMKPHGIKTAEFFLLRSVNTHCMRKILVIEAKKTLAAKDTDAFSKNLADIAV